MGALAILWMKGATPVSALAQGYQALISSLQTQLNGIISSLNANTTEASLQALLPGVQNQIVSAVKSAIKNGMDLLAKLAAAAGATEDNPVAQLVWLFTTSDLDATQPGAVVANDGLLALGNGYPQNPASQFGFDAEPGVTSSYNVTANFQGTLTADPQPVHLRPILQRLGVTSTGQAMAQLPASVQPPGSVTAWIDATT
jgi:hypothetical protein